MQGPTGPGLKLCRNLYAFLTSLLDGSEHISVSEASYRGISNLIATVADHSIFIENHGKAQAMVLSIARVAELNAMAEDLRDLVLVLSRAATDSGNRTTFDDVLVAFDLTRDDLRTIH